MLNIRDKMCGPLGNDGHDRAITIFWYLLFLGAHSTTQLGGVPSPTSENLGLGEEESQTKESPQYWDIKF